MYKILIEFKGPFFDKFTALLKKIIKIKGKV